jgi:hypothetical protein
VTQIRNSVQKTGKPRSSDHKKRMDLWVVSKTAERTTANQINLEIMNMPLLTELADPQFHTPNKVDILIGAEVFL